MSVSFISFLCLVFDSLNGENAINHLAGVDHLKNLKHFLWQYDGEMDRMDTYRILETDLTKYNTNEYQISNSRCPEVANFGSNFHEVNLCVPASADTSLWNSNDLKSNSSSQQNLLYKNGICSGNAYLSNVGVCQVYQSGSTANGEGNSQGLQSLTQFTSMSTVDAGGNVHSGAPPPWLEAADQTLLNDQVKPALSGFLSSNKSHKSRKLNPKRVGAAWAEKQKMELEKEKRREIVKSDFDANWLPNFGRVWQSCSRKESRK